MSVVTGRKPLDGGAVVVALVLAAGVVATGVESDILDSAEVASGVVVSRVELDAFVSEGVDSVLIFSLCLGSTFTNS